MGKGGMWGDMMDMDWGMDMFMEDMDGELTFEMGNSKIYIKMGAIAAQASIAAALGVMTLF